MDRFGGWVMHRRILLWGGVDGWVMHQQLWLLVVDRFDVRAMHQRLWLLVEDFFNRWMML